jgi:hypothetical protein
LRFCQGVKKRAGLQIRPLWSDFWFGQVNVAIDPIAATAVRAGFILGWFAKDLFATAALANGSVLVIKLQQDAVTIHALYGSVVDFIIQSAIDIYFNVMTVMLNQTIEIEY